MQITQWKSSHQRIVKSLIVLGVICFILSHQVQGYNTKGLLKDSKKSRRDDSNDQLAEETETSFSSRSQRADGNYMRNYHYPTRGVNGLLDSNGWDGGRQLSSFGLNSLLSSGSSPTADYASQYGGGIGPDPTDNFVAAGGHGHSSYGGGGGGHGGGGHSHGKDCNSALGLLGVLGLASYLQNVLRQMSTTAAAGGGGGGGVGRKKRELDGDYDSADVTSQILPFLMAIGHVREANISVKCAYRPICLANKILTNNLGDMAKPVTFQLSTAIGRMLTESQPNIQTLKEIKQAGKAGRASKDCEAFYPHCPQLNRLPDASMTLATLL